MRLTMYGRSDCCLCDEMWAVVQAVGHEQELAVEKIDVDGDPGLTATYGDRVPVLCVDGEQAFVYRVTAPALRARLAR